MAILDITSEEQAAFAQMQARLVELLLRHNEAGFQQLYDQWQKYDRETNRDLKRYRDLAVIVHLRDEMFEHILPRIVRRLSFESPRSIVLEEPPAQGRVDWDRTLDASWSERPGHPPLTLHTRQRRREFSTPENLLTVVTLLEYHRDIQNLLENERTLVGNEALRHPLNEIVDRCERELAFPQFAGLRQHAQQVIDGVGSDPETLELQVAERLLPGSNSAYEDLLQWRASYRMLDLLDRRQTQPTDAVLGADPSRDNYLYQLWLFYEIGRILQQRGAIENWDDQKMRLTYSWGNDDQRCSFVLQHDQGIVYNGRPWRPWNQAPGVRPDFYIRRVDAQDVRDEHGTVFWREPGYVLDAKYYRPRGGPRAPGNPVKRMVADLQLTEERHGALLFAFQRTASEVVGTDTDEQLEPDVAAHASEPQALYEVRPRRSLAQHTQPDITVGVWRVQPTPTADLAPLDDALTGLLEHVHQTLVKRVDVTCHGVFLDSLTANGTGAIASADGLVWRSGDRVRDQIEDLLVCPKPHVGPWRVDLVSLSRDCCQNGEVCHIINRPDKRKPKRLTALKEITEAIQKSADDVDDESVAAAATNQVLTITRRYAELLQPNIGDYQVWIRDELDIGDLFDTTTLLSQTQRETLALARFLWEQIDHIHATNYAGPTLLFTGVLEEVTRITIYRKSGKLFDANGKPLLDTLGTLGHSINYGGHNFAILQQVVVGTGFWKERIGAHQVLSFRNWIELILKMSFIRNDAAHKANVTPRQFRSLIDMYFGSPVSGIGVLNGLLLAWHDLPGQN